MISWLITALKKNIMFCNSERLYFGAKFLSYFINYSYEDILKNIKLAKTDSQKVKEMTLGDIMDKLLNEQVTYSMSEDLRESYDHELAMKDQGHRDGIKEGYASRHKDGFEQGIEQKQSEIIKNMLDLNMSKEDISKILKISIKDLNKIITNK